MKEFSANSTIEASAKTIWAILTDAASYPEWDPYAIRIEGTIAAGEKITAYTKLSPDRAFPVTVSEFVPEKRMKWTGGLPLGLFKGERTFTLTPQNGSICFTVQEQFTGPLLAVMGRSLPDMTEPFRDFVTGLKERAEAGTSYP